MWTAFITIIRGIHTNFSGKESTTFNKIHVKCKKTNNNKISRRNRKSNLQYGHQLFYSYEIAQIIIIERDFGNGWTQS